MRSATPGWTRRARLRGGAAYQSSCSGVKGLSSRSTHASSLARESGVGVEYDLGLVRLELHEGEEAADMQQIAAGRARHPPQGGEGSQPGPDGSPDREIEQSPDREI